MHTKAARKQRIELNGHLAPAFSGGESSGCHSILGTYVKQPEEQQKRSGIMLSFCIQPFLDNFESKRTQSLPKLLKQRSLIVSHHLLSSKRFCDLAFAMSYQ